MTELFLIIGIAHLLGDFYFQTSKMVNTRNKNIKIMLLHIFVYTGIFVLVVRLTKMTLKEAIIILGGIFITHLLIDKVVDFYLKKIECEKLYRIVLDQAMHLSILVLFFHRTDIRYENMGHYRNVYLLVLILLLILKPSAILVDKVLMIVNKEEKDKAFEIDAGTMIGMLERIIIVALCIFGGMSGIGFILTAKTMVRYGEFEKEEKVSDIKVSNTKVANTKATSIKLTRTKYLLGTLASTGIALGCYGLWWFLHIGK